MGGGRRQKNDAIDHRVGITDALGIGDKVEANKTALLTLHVNKGQEVDYFTAQAKACFTISPEKPKELPLVYETV